MGDTLDKVSAAVAETYISRAGITAEKAKELMDSESWLSASDSVSLGLATGVAEPEPGDESALALARSFKALKRLKAVPETLQETAAKNQEADCSCYCASCAGGRCPGCECDGCDSMSCDNDSCLCANNAMARTKPEGMPLSIFEVELEAIELSLRT
jgi:enoyl-CoA hydratase/carnithine racemase